ncbi:MAG TPA: TIGR02996 domain-containing protein [Gemmataceae bacterium]|nr:TIGR02996 domain-containing protein [Gemmataceae bacterium]
MTHEEAFLQAICDAPEDEGLRLIFADWLEEHDDPRGEFIRVQCALAHLDEDDPRRAALRLREHELLANHETEWVGPLLEFVDGWQFRRGFVEQVVLTPQAFLAHADVLFRLAPLRHVHLYRRNYITPGEVRPLARSPFLSRLATLRLNSDRGLRDDGVRLLAESPALANLTCLDLRYNWICNEGARALAASAHLERLHSLKLGGNPIGREGRQVLRARFGERVSFYSEMAA